MKYAPLLLLLVTFSCSQDNWHTVTHREDILDWMTMSPDIRGGNHLEGSANPLYTNVWKDKFYWTKGAEGWPWDIQLYDDKYVYLWITELTWDDPHTFKKFHTATGGDKSFPFAPRYVALTTIPQKVSTITIPDSSYEYHTSCSTFVVKGLKHAINEVWGPYPSVWYGGDVGSVTELVISYRYNCDDKYSSCSDKEQFHLAKPYGLVKWEHDTLQDDGTYVQDAVTVFNKLESGITTPVFPCF